MNETIIILFFACLLGLGGAMRVRHDQAKKEAARQIAAETVEAYPWDWTREDERKVAAAMELICDKCHEPYRCSAQDELDEACSMCPVADMLYRLAAEGRKERPLSGASRQQQSWERCTLPARRDSPERGEPRVGTGRREEARG